MTRRIKLRSGQDSFLGDPKEPLQIRIPSSVKRRFKATAALRGIEPNELFVEIWDRYEQSCDGDPGRDTK